MWTYVCICLIYMKADRCLLHLKYKWGFSSLSPQKPYKMKWRKKTQLHNQFQLLEIMLELYWEDTWEESKRIHPTTWKINELKMYFHHLLLSWNLKICKWQFWERVNLIFGVFSSEPVILRQCSSVLEIRLSLEIRFVHFRLPKVSKKKIICER